MCNYTGSKLKEIKFISDERMNEWAAMLEKSCTHANWYQALLHVHIFGAFRVFEVTADRRKEEYSKPEKKEKRKGRKKGNIER